MVLTYPHMLEQFEYLPDWLDRYELIIAWGRELPPFPESSRNDDHLVRGCQSRVYLDYRFDDGRWTWYVDSDAAIVRGLLAMVLAMYQNQRSEAIVALGTDWVTELGLSEHLSPTRRNGLAHVLATIQSLAKGQLTCA